jgi:hypothetical protein
MCFFVHPGNKNSKRAKQEYLISVLIENKDVSLTRKVNLDDMMIKKKLPLSKKIFNSKLKFSNRFSHYLNSIGVFVSMAEELYFPIINCVYEK